LSSRNVNVGITFVVNALDSLCRLYTGEHDMTPRRPGKFLKRNEVVASASFPEGRRRDFEVLESIP